MFSGWPLKKSALHWMAFQAGKSVTPSYLLTGSIKRMLFFNTLENA
jgi:hypothetical protein